MCIRDRIKAAQSGAMSWRIASPIAYAPVVEAGSRAHEIRPKRAKVLAFQVDGTKAAQSGAMSWRIASPIAYAPVVEAGSRAHEIRPKRAKVLAFQVGGTKVFTRRVRHPGSQGRFMFRAGADAVRGALPGILSRHVRPGV